MKKNRFELLPENVDYISGAMSAMTGVSFTPRVDTENSLIQYHYAMDDEDYVNKHVEGPNHKELIMKSILEDSGKDFREYAISKKLGLISNLEQNGVDSYKVEFNTNKGIFEIVNTYELKSERLRSNKTSKSGYSKLAGNFGIASSLIKNIDTVDEWIAKNDKIAVSGWVQGKIAYIVSFSTAKSKVKDHIIYRLKNGAKLENGGITFNYTHFLETEDLKVEYINKSLCTAEYVTESLLEKIFGLTKKKSNYISTVSSKDRQKSINKIISLLDSNLTIKEVAELTGKSKSTVWRVKNSQK